MEQRQTMIDLNVLQFEPERDYHAQAHAHLGSHMLIAFMRSPWLYRKRMLGLVDEESPAFAIGRAAHARILEGPDAYWKQFAFGGPINPRTGKPFGERTDAFADWAARQGKPVLSTEQAELVECMAEGVGMNQEALDLLAIGQPEGVIRIPYRGINCQVRIDWLHPMRGIVDLKTCDDLEWFQADCKRWHYHHQLAFYQAVLAERLRQDRGNLQEVPEIPVHVVAVEKHQPFRAGVWRLSDNTLAVARAENEDAMARLLRCQKNDDWPSGYEAVRELEIV